MTVDAITLITYVLATVTITYGVTESVLLAIPRMLFATRARWCEQLIYCSMCSSFWAGALAGLIVFDLWWPLRALLGALCGPGIVALTRVFDPTFLAGAQHEREHVVRIRDGEPETDEPAEAAQARAADADDADDDPDL